MYSNVRGMKSKMNSLIEILDDQNPHIYLLTETQLRSNVGMKIEGYTFYSRKREGKNGGGVGILVRNDLLHKSAPHITDRSIELMWISLRTTTGRPTMIGVYYGPQESRTNKDEIELEMCLLREEIQEMTNEGNILLAMDGNGKINLLNEGVSRNGKLLLDIFKETKLNVLNGTEICQGSITRKNTRDHNEISAIDFIVANEQISSQVVKMIIDEDGIHKVKGRHESDHNTISLELHMEKTNKEKVLKKTEWNLRASDEKWSEFREELKKRTQIASQILLTDAPFEDRYKLWQGQLTEAAMVSIGKTTFKEGGKEKFSDEVKILRAKKKEIKNEIKNCSDYERRKTLVSDHKTIQDETTAKIATEKTVIMKQRLQAVASDKSKRTFWKEKKKLARDPVLQQLTIKDANGMRQFQPESIKFHTALYYENLYKEKPFPPCLFHQEVSSAMQLYQIDDQHEDLIYNLVPTKAEVIEAIGNKTNGKSTTDIKNEMLKRPGENMSNFLYPLIEQIWEEEVIPSTWNTGHITSIWKGRNDKEKLENHRGITTSSAIGSIVEMLIDNRLEAHLPFTQAQGGGQRGASTCDHLFLMRTIIDVAKTEKRELFITFFDVSKAYDNVDNNDLMKIVWDKGIRGKLWRLLRNLNSDLRAKVKTKFGLTDEILMEIGGRQGSRITGRLFAKLMDLMAEGSLSRDEGFRVFEGLIIPMLLWIDDIASFAEGLPDQLRTLKQVDMFAKEHKLRWGQDKCQVMRIGKHKDESREWKIGEMQINETGSYKYLGDIVTNDGKNVKNLEARRNKTVSNTISIKTFATNEMFKTVATPVLLELHETISLSALLTNSESWVLSKGEKDTLDNIEIQAIKQLFDLPAHTPTPALIFIFGLLYTSLRVEHRQLIYMWKVLNRKKEHWTQMALNQTIDKNIGWGKSVIDILDKNKLPTDLEVIRRQGKNEWKRNVKRSIEARNNERLIKDLHKTEHGEEKRKTKTVSIVNTVKDPSYQSSPQAVIMEMSKQETKTLIISRYHMLECGANFKGTRPQTCNTCDVLDDENHRLNHCVKYSEMNRHDRIDKANFDDIYSDDPGVVGGIMSEVTKVWNLSNSNGTMIESQI